MAYITFVENRESLWNLTFSNRETTHVIVLSKTWGASVKRSPGDVYRDQ